ncbi:uncharacterized protein J8A68_005236 [[Candida] subhashii]|uniref:TATA element modulatory factor 1 TATA binding domain-containing protein n=1 Tax=[Candida] subhashii TaxID=561895 RepID=A0A8J5QMM5_9ASCO|nr:uncharacterized protein J8A68_005236 [[Candida] subhashii]KAG7661240.1 hypothetical protein J8A68_005236 [[Candida] subhashii]
MEEERRDLIDEEVDGSSQSLDIGKGVDAQSEIDNHPTQPSTEILNPEDPATKVEHVTQMLPSEENNVHSSPQLQGSDMENSPVKEINSESAKEREGNNHALDNEDTQSNESKEPSATDQTKQTGEVPDLEEGTKSAISVHPNPAEESVQIEQSPNKEPEDLDTVKEGDESKQQTPIEPDPKPEKPQRRKRLTLQERLAQAAKGKAKKTTADATESPKSSPPPRTISSPPATPPVQTKVFEPENVMQEKTTAEPEVSQVELIDRLREEIKELQQKNAMLSDQARFYGSSPKLSSQFNRSPQTNTREKELTELTAKLEEKDATIKQLLEEGETLSHKELKLNETIKKLRTTNQELEANLQDFLTKNEESTLKLQELEDFLRVHKYKSLDQVLTQFTETNTELANVKAELETERSQQWEGKYKELLQLHQEEINAKKAALKESNDLKIQLDMCKRQQSLELESKQNVISDLRHELSQSKHTYSQEISRLEDKIESLRLEQESSETSSALISNSNGNKEASEDISSKNRIDFDEFSKLSDAHHNLQKQYLSSQENWKLIESNLLHKIDSLTSTIESLKKTKNKLAQDFAKVNNTLISQSGDFKKLEEQHRSLKEEKEKSMLLLQEKDSELAEIREKFEKFKQISNQDRSNLNTRIQSLNETIDRLNQQVKKKDNGLRLDLEPPSRKRDFSSGSLSATSWNDIRFGESSLTPAINRDFSGIYYDNSRNQSSSSVTEMGDDSYDMHEQMNFASLTPMVSQIGAGGSIGGIPSSSSQGNNIQLVNKMSSNIRRLEIELNTLKDEYNRLLTEKEATEAELLETIKLNDEIVRLQSKINTLEMEIVEKNKKEQTMLELIGEKSEQVEELKADVYDLKEVCKLQVQQMLEFQGV